MMEPSVVLRSTKGGSSKARARVNREIYNKKLEQIEEAVRYCQENGCKGKKALSTGMFPLIKDHKTITRRLNGVVVHGEEKLHSSILTSEEEECLVRFIENKARAMQPLNRKELNIIVINMLKIRKALNEMKGGRKYQKLTVPANNALRKGNVSHYFWERFEAKYSHLTRKRPGNTSLARITACTRDMAIKHLDSLANDLIKNGIMTNYEKIEPGEWKGEIDGSRIFNREGTLQAIQYGVDGSARNLVYCPKGESCSNLMKENREYVTIEPFISLDGRIHLCHVIFSSASITTDMPPQSAVHKIPNLFVSVTENGYQTGESCFVSTQMFDKIVEREDIAKPITMLTDGHSSRFDLNVLEYENESKLICHVLPPDTTSLTGPLDQINASLHSSYANDCDRYFKDNHINRSVFMEILADIWDKWATKDSIVKAFKQCGISSEGLSVHWMQQEKLNAASL